MKEPNRKNKLDELEKEINALKERVTKIEENFKVKVIEEKPKTSFM
jgi:polyhydroxyalkanoate synthesis regulator phasin